MAGKWAILGARGFVEVAALAGVIRAESPSREAMASMPKPPPVLRRNDLREGGFVVI